MGKIAEKYRELESRDVRLAFREAILEIPKLKKGLEHSLRKTLF